MPKFVWTTEILTRDYVKAHPRTVFLFGDNSIHRGMGGMAKECRGEPNAVGIPTKWYPDYDKSSYFYDSESSPATLVAVHPRSLIEAAARNAERLAESKEMDGTIVVPAGLGLGLAAMLEKCPDTYHWMVKRLGGQ